MGPYLLLVGLPVGVLALFVLLGVFVLRAGPRKAASERARERT